jgi:hypothetical protein
MVSLPVASEESAFENLGERVDIYKSFLDGILKLWVFTATFSSLSNPAVVMSFVALSAR